MLREGIQTEHQEIHRAMAKIRELLDDPTSTDRLRASVAQLATLIQLHFEHEGRSHVFTKLPVELPRLAWRLDALRKDHVELLSELRATEASLSDLGRESADRRLRAWMEHLSAHEDSEQRLLDLAQVEETPFSD